MRGNVMSFSKFEEEYHFFRVKCDNNLYNTQLLIIICLTSILITLIPSVVMLERKHYMEHNVSENNVEYLDEQRFEDSGRTSSYGGRC